MNQNLKIYKANEIIESSYRLSLTEQRVLLACIAQINPNNATTASGEITLQVDNFADIFNANEKSAYEQLLDVSKNLHKKTLVFHNGEREITTTWLAGYVRYKKNPSAIGVYLSPLITPYLCELKEKFTCYRLGDVSGMSSIYGIRIYELLTQYRQFEKRKFSLGELKSILGITDGYSDVRDFKKAVIAPAVADINKCSDLKITDVTYQKKGRVIADVSFSFEPAKKKAAVLKKEKAIVKKPAVPELKPAESVAEEIYNENLKRYGKEIADKTKAASENVTPQQVAGQIGAFMRRAKVN